MHSHSVFPLGSQLSKHHSFHELLAHSALVIPENAGAARRHAALSEHSWHMGHTHLPHTKAAHSASTTTAVKAEGSHSLSE